MRHDWRLASAVALAAGLLWALPATGQEALQVGATFITSGLDPAKGSNGWALASHGIGEKLFSVDKNGVLGPELAAAAERVDDLNWTIKLAPGRSFSDGSAVTAAALARGFNNTVANNKAALATGGKLTFEAVDDVTLKVTTEKPVPLIQALFAEWPLIAYGRTDDGRALFTGPYEVSNFIPDASLDLEPNPHFSGADKRSPVALKRFGDAQTMALAFEAGELDLAFGLPSEIVGRLKSNTEVSVKSFAVGYQYMAFLNTTRPALADVRVRQAIDLTFDRSQLAVAINGGTPATGAYAPYFPFAGKDARPTDAAKAAALLDEAGWTAGANGKRQKDGEALTLLIIAYPQRPDLVTMLPVAKAELEAIGIEVDTKVVENISEVAAAGDFDVALWAQHTAPSGDPAFFLNSMLRTGAALNYSKYASADFDIILDKFASSGDASERNSIASEAQAKLFQDVPVSFLVSPQWHVGVSNRLANYEPWGSDYHVLRADIGEAP